MLIPANRHPIAYDHHQSHLRKLPHHKPHSDGAYRRPSEMRQVQEPGVAGAADRTGFRECVGGAEQQFGAGAGGLLGVVVRAVQEFCAGV